ncbi:TPA: hypothetical protein J8Y49_002357 [Enterococcus faecium]|nr:hypothetical protein [Enterococcus faecium]
MSEIKKLAKELQDYTRVVGSHNKHIQSVANRLVELTEQPQLNENQQVLSGSELIGVIYSQLLEDFGFGYIEKDLWMIAENLSEKIANDQPKLIPNQQIVLEWLKEEQAKNPELTIFGTLSVLFDESENRFMNLDVIDALYELTDRQQAEILQAFSAWALEQEEEK